VDRDSLAYDEAKAEYDEVIGGLIVVLRSDGRVSPRERLPLYWHHQWIGTINGLAPSMDWHHQWIFPAGLRSRYAP
jgi:hypothetical protein